MVTALFITDLIYKAGEVQHCNGIMRAITSQCQWQMSWNRPLCGFRDFITWDLCYKISKATKRSISTVSILLQWENNRTSITLSWLLHRVNPKPKECMGDAGASTKNTHCWKCMCYPPYESGPACLAWVFLACFSLEVSQGCWGKSTEHGSAGNGPSSHVAVWLHKL